MKLLLTGKPATRIISFFAFIIVLSFPFLGWGQFTMNGATLNSGSYTCGTSTFSEPGSMSDETNYSITICPAANEVVVISLGNIVLNNAGGTGSDDVLTITQGAATLYTDGTNSLGVDNVVITGTTAGACVTVTLQVHGSPGTADINATIGCLTAANAGVDQSLGACATSTTLNGNDVSPATGTWTASPSSGITFSPNANTPGATVSGMTPGTNYTFTWTSSSGGASDLDQMTVTTTAGPGCWDYCDVTWSDNPADDWISNVTFNTIANTSGANANGYGNYTGACTPVILSSTYQLCVTVSVVAAFTQHVFAYFDWNNDGDFSDAGESVDLGQVTGTGTLCSNITIPAGATLGNTVMRIVEKYNTNPVSACESGTYGETEDYCVTIVNCTMNTPVAGGNQTLASCDTDAVVTGNVITDGTGMWSLVSGSGNIVSPNSTSTTITDLGPGANVFSWTATPTVVGCPILTSSLTITTTNLPSVAYAGADLGGCAASQTMAATAPTSGTGTWTLISGCGVAASPNSATSVINGLCIGENVWEWTVVNAACPSLSTSDQVTITVAAAVTTADAGDDQTGICYAASSPGIATLNGNTPIVGTGTWSVVSNTTGGSVASVNDPTSNITGINAAGSITLTWTISSPGCPSTSDNVTISSVLCNGDEPCQALGLAVSSGTCSYSTYSNVGMTMSTGMPEPGCAAANGPDIWFTATIPPSGQVQISGQVQGTFDPLISVYDGSCGSLEFNGCVSGTGSNVYPLTYAGAPGSVIYIRVNEGTTGDATTGSFGVCVYEATTPTISEVLPGVTTTVTCGDQLNFYDPGGQGGTSTTSTSQPPPAGNYSNNTGSQWVICPSDPSQIVSISFSQFYVENGFDKVIVLSGDIVIAQWTYNQGAGDVVTAQAPGECLTVVLQSDYIYTGMGWEAIVSCTTAIVPPQISNACQVNNCNGECGVWVCADGIYDTQAGAGAGIDEINEVTGGCWGAAGEVATSWFYFTIAADGELAFEFVPSNNGHNINFALYGPSTDGTPPCPLSTGDAPIRCSFATDGGINTGLQTGQTDLYDIATGDGMSAPLAVSAGQTYALVVDVYQNGQPPTETEIDFTGAAALDCSPVVLPITLGDFSGINQDRNNLLNWTVYSQMGNDYFTVERSMDGKNWEKVGDVDGAGTTQSTMYYSLLDENPYFPVSYYRLSQTDLDGGKTYSNIISITNNKGDENTFVGNIFPNPTGDFTTFTFEGNDTETPLNITILNQLGEVVQSFNHINLHKGSGAIINTSQMTSGLYHVIFTQGNKRQSQKLAIIR